MYLTIHNTHKIIQSLWTHPLFIDMVLVNKDKYTIHLYISNTQSNLHIIKLWRHGLETTKVYPMLINGKHEVHIPHDVITNIKDFIQFIHNEMMYYYPLYF